MILLDTCVLSEIARPTPDRGVLTWYDALPDEQIVLSVLTIGELQKGIELLEPGTRRSQLQRWLDGLVELFGTRILRIDEPEVRRWGSMSAAGRRAGRVRSPVDGLLAATALHHDLTLATRNEANFEGTGVRLINPWQVGPRG